MRMLKEVCRPEKSILTLNGIGVCFRFDVSKLFPRTNRDESTFMEKKGRLMARDSSSSLFSKRERESFSRAVSRSSPLLEEISLVRRSIFFVEFRDEGNFVDSSRHVLKSITLDDGHGSHLGVWHPSRWRHT